MGNEPRRVVMAITGASGAAFGLRMLELLRDAKDVESHLVVSKAGALTLRHECDVTLVDVRGMADVTYRSGDIGAAIASGSFPVDAMLGRPLFDQDAVRDRLQPRGRTDHQRPRTSV